MKRLAVLTALVLFAFAGTALADTATSNPTAPTVSNAKRNKKHSARVSGINKSSTMASGESSESLLGSTQLDVLAGASFLSNFSGAVISVKASHKFAPSVPLYGEGDVGATFNGQNCYIPLDAGLRYDFGIARLPRVTPFAHLSVGPAISTSGSVAFHLFTGPGFIMRVARNIDARFDMGLVMFATNPGFQFTTGIAL